MEENRKKICDDVINKFIEEPKLLIADFRSDNEARISRTFLCLRASLFEEFTGIAHKTVLWKQNFDNGYKKSLIRDSFDEGLGSFYFFIREKGFEKRSTTLKNFFFEFCKRKLMGKITMQKTGEDPGIIFENISENWGIDPHLEIEEQIAREEQERNRIELYHKGLNSIGEKCFNLLTWQKIEKLEKEEIAKRSNLSPVTVNNEVYRCFKKLKKYIDDHK